MQAFIEYVRHMPPLAQRLLERLAEALEEGNFDHNNADELRLAYKEAQQVALERIEDSKLPYYGLVYPQTLSRCPTCDEELKGAYWEISNPLTKERGMFRVRLVHELLAHGKSAYTEPVVNMSDTLMGYDEHAWDTKKLMKVLNGLPVPPDVVKDIQAIAAEQAKNKGAA